MRTLLFGTAVIAGVVWIGLAPANTAPQSMPGIGNANIEAAAIKNVGYRRRYYRRYGYPVPYAYYPPAYGYRKALSPRKATTVTLHPQKVIMPTLRLRKATNRTTAIRFRG